MATFSDPRLPGGGRLAILPIGWLLGATIGVLLSGALFGSFPWDTPDERVKPAMRERVRVELCEPYYGRSHPFWNGTTWECR